MTATVYDRLDRIIDEAVADWRTPIFDEASDDAVWRDILARADAEPGMWVADTRPCDRCGINTTDPGMCRDCVDVVALEAYWR